MLKKLELTNVGPVPQLTTAFGPRINIFTGDNGLGKSFLLDILWFVLTRCWPAEVNQKLTSGFIAKPFEPGIPSKISFELSTNYRDSINIDLEYIPSGPLWKFPQGRPSIPGLVIFAHIDGSFSVWDPTKNYGPKGEIGEDFPTRPAAFVFSPQEVWYGLGTSDGSTRYCNGLLQDIYDWQKDKDWKIEVFNTILKDMSPADWDLSLGIPVKLSLMDSRKIPTIHMPYGDIPIIIASAGIKRIFALAYFLSWALVEHIENCQELGKSMTSPITFLMDEVEAHLHPKWQRKIIGSLLTIEKQKIISQKTKKDSFQIQYFIATHSPLVMASLEPLFDEKQDKWFDLQMENNGKIQIISEPFEKKGDANQWLKSNAFDLESTYSVETEETMDLARKLLSAEKWDDSEIKKIYNRLLTLLTPQDNFLFRFRALCDSKGIKLQ